MDSRPGKLHNWPVWQIAVRFGWDSISRYGQVGWVRWISRFQTLTLPDLRGWRTSVNTRSGSSSTFNKSSRILLDIFHRGKDLEAVKRVLRNWRAWKQWRLYAKRGETHDARHARCTKRLNTGKLPANQHTLVMEHVADMQIRFGQAWPGTIQTSLDGVW